MNKKAFNEGVGMGVKVSQKVFEQEIETMDYLKLRIDLIVDGHDEMKSAVNRLIADNDEKAIIDIFGVCNKDKPKDLKEHEKMMLLNILATLSSVELNNKQKCYFNNLRHHLDLRGYEPDFDYDFRKIEFLESVRSIKIIAKATRIFLYLQDLNMDGIHRHEEDLFSHFELRSFDEIDALIELVIYLFGEDGLVEMYGDFGEAEEFEQKDLRYLNVKKVDRLDISHECAQVYFEDCFEFDSGRQYIESSSYILYSEGNSVIRLHKKTCVRDVMIENIENAAEFIKKGKLATFSDMGYYVLKNDLYYIDLSTLDTGFILHITEEKNEDGRIYEVAGLTIYNSQKCIYDNGSTYIIDLEEGITSVKKISLGEAWIINESKYTLRGDYIYFVDTEMEIDMDSYNSVFDKDKYGFIIKKYGILNGQTTAVSKIFGKHKIAHLYELVYGGMYDKYYCCVLGWVDQTSTEDYMYHECFYIDTETGGYAEAKPFYIWNKGIYQIEQYKENLIYVNADKKYSLTSHDFLHDKKRILKKNYGKDEKASFSDKLLSGKGFFQNPDKYMRLGQWIWTQKENELNPEIISL